MIPTLEDSRQATNQFLETYLERQVVRARGVHPAYEQLWYETKRSVMAGGKRLRPYLVQVAAGELSETSVHVGAVFELLHAALLLHDDMIDRDTVRHGQTNLIGRYREHYQADAGNDSEHFANSAAVLAGDLLVGAAYELIYTAPIETEKQLAVNRQLHSAMWHVTGGEFLDTEAAFRSGEYDPLLIYRHKTASYSFVSPLLAGAVLAERDSSMRAALQAYGDAAGIAFQLRDDYLGVFGSSDVTGKTTSGDLVEGKRTYLIETFLQAGSNDDKALFARVKAEAREDDIAELRQRIRDSSAVAAAEAAMQRYAADARGALESIADTPLRTALDELLTLVTTRSS